MENATQQANWDHVNETIKLLTLAVAQIDMSMTEGDQSVNALSSSFISLAKQAERIRFALESHPELANKIDSSLLTDSQDIVDNINTAVVAFQFYDRISQRLDHVCSNLDGVSELIGDQTNRSQPKSWELLQHKIRSSYTMEAERLMFEHILMGHSVEQALEIYRHHFNENDEGKNDEGDDVELF